MKRIAVYCGSNQGVRPEYAAAAQALGTLLAREKIELVYGGGSVGLMGIVADAALAHGGHVIGVIPQKLHIREIIHHGLPDLRIVNTFFEVLAWSQLGWHTKPFGLLNIGGFYDPLLKFLEHTRDEGFIRPQHHALVLVAEGAEKMLQELKGFRPPSEAKWVK